MGKRKYTRQPVDRSQTAHLEKVKVEHVADCEDCGKSAVLNRRVLHTRHHYPMFHWRSKCCCGKYQHPITGEWIECDAYTLNSNLGIAFRALKRET